jgi:hypothetical protein
MLNDASIRIQSARRLHGKENVGINQLGEKAPGCCCFLGRYAGFRAYSDVVEAQELVHLFHLHHLLTWSFFCGMDHKSFSKVTSVVKM